MYKFNKKAYENKILSNLEFTESELYQQAVAKRELQYLFSQAPCCLKSGNQGVCTHYGTWGENFRGLCRYRWPELTDQDIDVLIKFRQIWDDKINHHSESHMEELNRQWWENWFDNRLP